MASTASAILPSLSCAALFPSAVPFSISSKVFTTSDRSNSFLVVPAPAAVELATAMSFVICLRT